ncbi:hypothetical protein JVU11DRAFT_10797 [Chiua virens]|nr:hypothetical protein JVU11DRAFT_10797 [Chiua virens]
MPPLITHKSRQHYQPTGVKCKYCGMVFKPQGLTRHEKSCQHHIHNPVDREQYTREFEEEVKRVEQKIDTQSTVWTTATVGDPGPAGLHHPSPFHPPGITNTPDPHVWGPHVNDELDHVEHFDDGADAVQAPQPESVGSGSMASGPLSSGHCEVDPDDISVVEDFKTVFHPRSIHHLPLYQSAAEFGQEAKERAVKDEAPWRPFRTAANLEFADIANCAGLNARDVNALLSLISRVADRNAEITFRNERELRQACDRAAEELTPFTKIEVTAEYQKQLKTFDVHMRPLWDWALDLLNNPRLAPHFVWDAQRVYRHDGDTYKRFYTEPWTGDRWWEIQSGLPQVPNATPLAFILYADKTRLSSHGTVKAYPVVTRCANLPVGIRNGEGFGGGCVVGWLPIVPEPAKEEHKTGWTNFKCVIWHESFAKLLDKMFVRLSEVGYKHKCYDEVIHWLFPLILILSADYEELCMMTLNQGTKCKFPCPECLNVFWRVRNSDPELAASFDRLHYLHGGLWGKHLLEELKKILNALGREAATKVEELVSDFPRWRDLAHFDTVMHITFSDGNKLRDLAKQVYYAVLHVLTPSASPEGYHWLRMLSTYLQIDSLLGLDVHTDETLSTIDQEILLQSPGERSNIEDLKTNWDFPKVHLWKHVTWDIRMKGVVRNYSTRPNEKMHGALKAAYADRMNGKDIAKQILCVDHHSLAIKLLRSRMEAVEEHQATNADEEITDSVAETSDSVTGAPRHVYLGSPCQPVAISEIEGAHQTDRAFENFSRKFTDFINTCVPTYAARGCTLIGGRGLDQRSR